MDKKILGVIVGVAVVIGIAAAVFSVPSTEIISQKQNENIGLVINTPNQATTLEELDETYSQASSAGIGRSNVYMFWNIVEPVRGEYNWDQSDVFMSFNKNNNLKVTLYFSIINGETLGPFPNWIGKPTINAIGEDRVVNVLDAILSRYYIIDTVILSGETESQFRYHEQNIPVYNALFNGVYDKIKEKHPDVKIGNAFALHHVLNKNLNHIVTDLAVGDFIGFSYAPVDSLNEISKTPTQAKDDLYKMLELAEGKEIVIFEISSSSSDFVLGDLSSQTKFLEKSFEFYNENESQIDSITWYRQYDRPEGTCAVEEREIGESEISVGGSGFGSSEHVIERLSNYICSAGLIENDGKEKPAWNEFKKQIQMIN